jgi:hypothetical protein
MAGLALVELLSNDAAEQSCDPLAQLVVANLAERARRSFHMEPLVRRTRRVPVHGPVARRVNEFCHLLSQGIDPNACRQALDSLMVSLHLDGAAEDEHIVALALVATVGQSADVSKIAASCEFLPAIAALDQRSTLTQIRLQLERLRKYEYDFPLLPPLRFAARSRA